MYDFDFGVAQKWHCYGFCWRKWVFGECLDLINRLGPKTHDECQAQNAFLPGDWGRPVSRSD